MSKQIKTLEIERALLACFLKDPGWLGEVSGFIKSDFFAYIPNQKIFSAIKSLYQETKTVDQHILVSRLNLMGLTAIESIDVDYYIAALSSMSINLDAKIGYLDELTKFYWSRQTYKKLYEAQKFIEESLKNPDLTFSDILSGTEKIVTDAVTGESVNGDDTKFVDLNGDMEDLLNKRVAKKGNLGIDTPFRTFNRWYGPLMIGGLYVLAAYSKVGKSSILSAIVDYGIENAKCLNGGKVKCLFIDTEMTDEEVACRKMAAKTGVNAFYYLNGTFSEDQEKIDKTEESLSGFRDRSGLIYHYYLPAASTDEIERVAKRFHSKYIGPDDIFILVLDYLKLSEQEGADKKEYQMVGEKTDRMKQLAKNIPNTISITAIQTNRENDIAQADRVKWYADGIFHLIRKTPEEIGNEGKHFGTHKIKLIAARNFGEFADESGPVPVLVGNKTEWRENYINLRFENFKVTESGTFKDVVEEMQKAGQLIPAKPSAVDSRKQIFNRSQ